MDSGIGETQLNALFSTMNIPTICYTTLKRHERIVGPVVESVAYQSMVKAAILERELTMTEPGKKLTVSLDMGWQKRGNGYCYNSLSGHSSMIGAESGKVMAAQVMSSACTSCQRKGGNCGKMTCKRNHDGSAKSMEAAAALLMLESPTLKEADVVVEVVAGDADSSTAAAIRNTYGDKITKALDLTHAKKNFKNQLFAIQKQHKRLTKQAILYLTATVGAVLSQNKGNPENLSKALKNIPEHTFNKHDNCHESWCRYKTDPNNYKSRYLAKSLGEYGCDLYKDLCSIIEKLINKAEELAVGGSTQVNESFNNQVCSKTPKYKHYSGTESLTFRVNCAVLQKNEGVGYVTKVNEKLALSPGEITQKYKEKLKKKREKEAALRKEPKEKARRKLNFSKRGQLTARLESSEGVTYSSGMVFDQSNDSDERNTCTNPVTSNLKLWKNPPLLGSLTLPENFDYSLIFFDLETGGLASDKCDILQISASSTRASFDIYCLPTKNISPAATTANSISYRNNTLFYKGSPVHAIPIKEALSSFISYLKMHNNCVLVAHNAIFDMKFLVEKLSSLGMLKKIEVVVIGYIDTLKLARSLYREEKKKGNIDNFKLATICKFVLGEEFQFDAHNAAADVQALLKFYTKANPDLLTVKKSGKNLETFLKWFRNSKEGQKLETVGLICKLTSKNLAALVKNGLYTCKLQKLAANKTETEFKKCIEKCILDEVKASELYKYLKGSKGESPSLLCGTRASNLRVVTGSLPATLPQHSSAPNSLEAGPHRGTFGMQSGTKITVLPSYVRPVKSTESVSSCGGAHNVARHVGTPNALQPMVKDPCLGGSPASNLRLVTGSLPATLPQHSSAPNSLEAGPHRGTFGMQSGTKITVLPSSVRPVKSTESVSSCGGAHNVARHVGTPNALQPMVKDPCLGGSPASNLRLVTGSLPATLPQHSSAPNSLEAGTQKVVFGMQKGAKVIVIPSTSHSAQVLLPVALPLKRKISI